MKDNYVKAYTRWINSDTTKEVLLTAQAALINQVHGIEDDTMVGASKAHWYRKGGEVILNYLTTQMTVDQLTAAAACEDTADYGAQDIVDGDLFTRKEGEL